MLRRIFNILTVASLIFFTALTVWAIPSFFYPKFEIVNDSTESIFVVAEWRNESKEVGSIEPMSSYIFSIDAEAAMKFRVIYADGRQADSEQIY
ncbi:MAG: hypothetical protein KJO69_00485, partial [Gammaproteobacteria bacterium]|nr:hypothetical protein [Gammaproteobacteria bacterium]